MMSFASLTKNMDTEQEFKEESRITDPLARCINAANNAIQNSELHITILCLVRMMLVGPLTY